MLIQLTENAKKEKYINNIQKEIDNLNKEVIADKAQHYQNYKDEIKAFLTIEIVNRYHHYAGEIESSLGFDNDVSKAKELLLNTEAYYNLLSPEK